MRNFSDSHLTLGKFGAINAGLVCELVGEICNSLVKLENVDEQGAHL
jgi:hypothetical protein